MPDVTITIGGRAYEVSCQPGEEPFLTAAAKLLDAEAAQLTGPGARMPEARTLLMAGLMLADKTAGIDEQLRAAEARAAELEQALARAHAAPPERVEVPMIPGAVIDTLSELAARAEALADEAENRAAG